MQTLNRRLTLATIALTTSALLAACGGAEGDDSMTIKVGIYPNSVLTLPIAIADGEDFFADEDLEVEIINGKTGPELISTMIGGSTQVAGSSSGTAIPALNEGQDLKVLPPFQRENKTIMVLEESGMTKLSDLVGKRIAAPVRGGDAESFASEVLQEQGVDPTSVTFIGTGAPGTMQAALNNDKADAAIGTAATIEQMRSNGTKVVAIANSLEGTAGRRGERGIASQFVTTGEFWENNPETINAFCRVMRTTVEYMADEANRDVVVGYIEDYIGVETEFAEKIYERDHTSWVTEIDESLWGDNVEFLTGSRDIPFEVVENDCGR